MATKEINLDEVKETAFIEGQRAVWRNLVQQGLSYFEGNEKTRTELLAERAKAIAAMKTVCEQFDLPIEWEDDLHLADIIEKHIYRSLQDRIKDEE